MIDVLLPRPLLPVALERLEASVRVRRLFEASDREAFLAAVAPDVRALAVGFGARIDGPFMDRFPALELIASLGVGYDNIDAHAAAARGVTVTNTPGVLDDEVADAAMGLLIATVRQLPQADRYLRAGGWLKGPFPLTASLRGRTLGILGLGRIGKAIARRAEGFGLRIVYHGRNPQEDVAWPYFPTVLGLARACDILMVVTPGGAATRHLVNAPVLEALGPQGVLINVARGSVVDEAALIAALKARTILTAGLDVFADEPHVPADLIAMEHVVLLPHVASASQATREAMALLVADNVLALARGGPPLTPVPETPWRGWRETSE